MRRLLITGAAGYIGGRLIPTLSERGWEILALVREPAPRLQVEQVVCDLASPDAWPVLHEASRDVESVIHLAGEDEVVAGRQPAAALAATMVATERVAEAAARCGVRRVVYLSTIHVYGSRIVPGATLDEGMRAEPRSAYAISRLASEHVAASFAGPYDLVVFRLSNSVGAPDDPSVDRWSLVTNDLCRQGATLGRLELRSSGTQWRDFVSLRDVCRALAASAEGSGSLTPGTYNLASGRPVTVRDLAHMVQAEFERQTGRRPELHAPAPEDEPPGPYHVSIERAAAQGLRLDSPLENAVAETVRFCLEHKEELP